MSRIKSSQNYCIILFSVYSLITVLYYGCFAVRQLIEKIEQIQKRGLQLVYNEPVMSLEELLNCNQGIRINVYENHFHTHKNVLYNSRTYFLTVSKVNIKKFCLCSFIFCAGHVQNELPDHINK